VLSNRDSYKRRVAKLGKLLAEHRDRAAQRDLEHSRARVHYQQIVARHIADERRGDQLLLEDRFKIQELENQVAVQWKNLAEAKDDAGMAKLNQQALGKELGQVRAERSQLRAEKQQWEDMLALQRQEMEKLFARTPAGWWRSLKTLIGRA
jgi:hypothetical protein